MKKKAVAVKYTPKTKTDSPQVIAKGFGEKADILVKKAKELGIVTYEDPDVVEILSKVNLGDEIPGELFEVVAEILVFAYKINNKFPDWLKGTK
ncbi:MAG: EscU/YscU/HrcU family type III secretion system export apparatus switch protein [Candidatus Muirbacterium halophilum]|nr:EscU/YscU/HrcU family type III secretion system export apparatus switch protein [Candidatus Muirbacterium halophilum]MCK9475760.1 EscU/YscU/HrcU family type III secretion system export apparatus switch protein [Candidatus Muirbacterium halophilum]